MKKLLIILSLATLSCKKAAAPAPASSSTTSPSGNYLYYYDYNTVAGGSHVYSGQTCVSPAQMVQNQQLYGWFNIRQITPC